MTRERGSGWGKTMILGAGSALAIGLGGDGVDPGPDTGGFGGVDEPADGIPGRSHWSATRSTVQTFGVRVR
jgi:hypothetical protein